MKKALLGIALVGLLSVRASTALADHVCAVTYDPPTSNLGSSGGVSLTLFTGVKCTGSQTGIKRFCSSGATNTGCAAGVTLALNTLLQIYATAADSITSGLSASGQVATCIGGGSGCWSNISFIGN